MGFIQFNTKLAMSVPSKENEEYVRGLRIENTNSFTHFSIAFGENSSAYQHYNRFDE